MEFPGINLLVLYLVCKKFCFAPNRSLRLIFARDAMTSSVSPGQMASPESPEPNNDLISSMPAIVIDKILKHLPLAIAAKTSILSRAWRRTWLSCHYLVFDVTFWEDFCKSDESVDWQKGSNIISSILFHHNGRIHSIHIELRPDNADLLIEKNANISRWMSLISRNCPKKITLINWVGEWTSLVLMPSYIFHCTDLKKLKLQCFLLNSPPFEFKGFSHLRSLELCYMKFNNGIGMLWSLVAKCPCLVLLRLENCLGMDILDIYAPTVETLIIRGNFDSLRLKKAPCLIDVSLCSTKLLVDGDHGMETVVATINSLADSHELQCLAIDGSLSKFLAKSGINKQLPVAFNYLHRLCLTDLLLDEFDVFCFTLGMVQSCPLIKDLEISIREDISAVGLHPRPEKEYRRIWSDEYKLGRLHKVKITGITGSSSELKLIEYILAMSVVLEKLFFRCQTIDAGSELTVLKQMIRLPRASTKAELVCLDE